MTEKKILVFAQGSYKNKTYVKFDSDVEICVMLKDAVFVDYPDGYMDDTYSLSSSDFTYL